MASLRTSDVEGLLTEALGLPPGAEPFPWQKRLLRMLCDGSLPSAIDIPTGLGKTSVIPIWLLAWATGAKLPRRLVYVVDRRAVVDQATDVADGLAAFVGQHPDLATALGVGDRGLVVSTLRGQHADNRRWLEDPSAPAVIVGTVDMIGSRLLFEGYGASRKTRSLHAGLLGVDSLLVLDEAHLAPSFEAMVRAISTPAFDGTRSDVVPARVKLLPLSATQDAKAAAFTLNLEDGAESDLQNKEALRRLNAQKWLALHDAVEDGDAHADAVAQTTLGHLEAGASRVVVYLNSRDQTQKALDTFLKLAKGQKREIETEMLVGARRVQERGQVADWLVTHGFHGSHPEPRPGVLFATSAGEVGVDLDAEHLICDLVAFERMIQRLGRVNRRGKHVSLVDVIPVNQKEKKKKGNSEDDEDEGAANEANISMVVQLLTSIAAREDGRRNVSPIALRALQERRAAEVKLASTPEPLHPALTRPVVESWAMTSLAEHAGRPKVEPWLRGWVDSEPQTTVVWRKHLPVQSNGKALSQKWVRAYFEAAAPARIETLETETFNVLKWLKDVIKRVDAEKSAGDSIRSDEVIAFILDGSGDVLSPTGLTISALGELIEGRDGVTLLNGKTLAIDLRLGGLEAGLLEAKSDATEINEEIGRGFRVVVKAAMNNDAPDMWRRSFVAPRRFDDDGVVTEFLLIDQQIDRRPDEDSMSVSKDQTLNEHQDWASDEAKRIGDLLQLAKEDVELLTIAAKHHDDGKAADRWQKAFHAKTDTVYAKVGKSIDQGILDGYRHETGSLLGLLGLWNVHQEAEAAGALADLRPDRRDLALHLVSSHHGWSRPTLSIVNVDGAPPSKLVEIQREAAERFARLQDEWGPWGLAWWESLLRAADGIASRRNEKKKGGAM